MYTSIYKHYLTWIMRSFSPIAAYNSAVRPLLSAWFIFTSRLVINASSVLKSPLSTAHIKGLFPLRSAEFTSVPGSAIIARTVATFI